MLIGISDFFILRGFRDEEQNNGFRQRSDVTDQRLGGASGELGITGHKVKESKRNVYSNINRTGSIKLKERKEKNDYIKNHLSSTGHSHGYSHNNGVTVMNHHKD